MRRREVGSLFLLTVVPLLLGGRGQVNADTKQYLYLDPLDLLDRSRTVWDSRVGGGAVTHQGIGYLWPMGPYYALTDAIGLPDWASQRLWVGLLQLAAATGALALFRHLLPRTWVHVPAAAAYGLSPFVLGHVTNVSGLLVPFAGLGWLILCMAKAVEEPRSWRWPAAFALIVTTCGSLNGSSVLFVVLAAALWVPFAVARTREGRWDGVRVLVRAGALTLVTQAWWLVAYAVGGAYNLPILETTETVQVTNGTTSSLEVLRGLGYWFFYGDDTEGLWLRGLATPYLRSGVLLVVTFSIPILALAAGALTRWRHRAYFTLLVVGGTFLAVGAYPIADPSPLGRAFERLSRSSDAVLSLRNTQRAGALVGLGLAGLLAAALTALHARARRTGAGAALALLVLVAAAMPAQWRSGLVAERGHRPEDLPTAWTEAMAALDEGEGRILELPGSDFAAYRWGETLDPISVGLTDRPVIARELVPLGGDAGADLLEALDRSIQEGWFEPASLAPVARLLGATEVLIRNDLEYERYRTARPSATWPLLSTTEAGLQGLSSYGQGYRNVAGPRRPMIDEIDLGIDGPVRYPQVATLRVPDSGRAPLSARPADQTVVLDGDGEGVVAAAAAGLLDGDRLLLLGADLVAHGDAVARAEGTAMVVLTDSNRKRAKRWYTLRANAGATEPADRTVVPDDPADARLEVAGTTPPGTQTVVEWRGVERVWADDYGTTGYLLPEDRPSNALDGDLATAWRSERGPHGERRRWGVELERPSDAGHVTLVAPQDRYGTVTATRVRVILDGERRIDADVPAEASGEDGFDLELDGEPFRRLEVEILESEPATGMGGFAEVQIPGVTFEEVVRLPTALAEDLGAHLRDQHLAVVLTRLRANPAEPYRSDPEPSMVRAFALPVRVDLEVTGTARIDTAAPEPLLDELLGAGQGVWGVRATSTARLAGDLDARASSALDGDRATAWQTPLSTVEGQALEVELREPVTVSTLPLDLLADDRHSVPTQLRVVADDGDPMLLDVPAVEPGPDGTAHVDLPLPEPVTARSLRIEIADIAPRSTTDWQTLLPFTLPVGIAEVALPGVPSRPAAQDVDTGCRDDLLTVDGETVPVRIAGDPEDTATAGGLAVSSCAPPASLGSGDVTVRTVPGRSTGLSLDRLVLRTPTEASGFGPRPEPLAVDSERHRPGHVSGTVESDGEPFWLVVDESMNDGWELDVDGARVIGPRPVDSYAAGFYVVPDGPGPLSVTARWAPQRAVDVALALSALGVLVCLALVVRGRRAAEAPNAPIGAPVIADAGRPPPWAALAAAALAAVLVAPEAALAGAALGLVAWRWPRAGTLLPVALVAASAAAVVVLQVGHEHPATFVWPTRFHWVHQTTAVALVVIGVLALTSKRGERPPVTSPP